MTLTTISYGGGVQSTAMVVLAVEGRLGYTVDAALFANVGDDSEEPATLDYVRRIVTPWAADRGLPVHEVHRVTRTGETETLYGRITRPDYNGICIPVRGVASGPLSRDCTADFKVAPMGRWLKEHGASTANPATVLIGISVDEIERAGKGSDKRYERRAWPLLALGLNRNDCTEIIRSAGLPVPPKSSCWFCPFHSRRVWAEMRRDRPDTYAAAVTLEATIGDRQTRGDRLPVYLHPPGLDTIPPAQDTLPGFEPSTIGESGCDEGYCWT